MLERCLDPRPDQLPNFFGGRAHPDLRPDPALFEAYVDECSQGAKRLLKDRIFDVAKGFSYCVEGGGPHRNLQVGTT